MIYERAEFDYELFKNPTAIYRGLPFWSWNGKIKKDVIDRQLNIFKEMGLGGVVMHPREGLDTEYLGDEFMEMIKHTSDKCRELGLYLWIYDDDRFPSGAADGLVTKDPRCRARQLRLTVNKLGEGYFNSREEFEADIDSGNIPRGYYLTAYALRFENGRLADYFRLAPNEKAPEGYRTRFAYVELQEPTPWFNGESYADTMDPAAVDEFIKITHERYKKALGDDFGKTAAAMFTDEPRLGKQMPPARAESDEDVYIPYTDNLAKEFAHKYGFELLDIAPEFFWARADGDMTNRLIYRDTAAECFVKTYMDRICDWCRENGILMTGHVLAESPLGGQTTTLGEAMRCYRNMDIPGIDILIDSKEFTSLKQAASVASQYGREAVMSEEYGVTHWDCTFKTYKLQGDWQAALGVTMRVPHLSHMTLEGEAKRDWPGSIFYQAPWHKEWRELEDHFARLNTVLSRGKRVTRVGVIHPVESMWISFGPDDLYGDIRDRLDKEFVEFADRMLYGTLDFDYISESLLPEQNPVCGERLTVGEAEYSAVVVPGLLTIRSTTLDILESFAENGGTVIFTGPIPCMVDGKPRDRAARLASKCRTASDALAELEAFRDIKITKPDGSMSDNILCQIREDNDCKWLFLAHARHSGTSKAEKYTVKLCGEYSLTVYDTMTGKRYPLPSRIENGRTVFDLTCFGEDSLLLRLDGRGAENAAMPDIEYKTIKTIRTVSAYERTEPNALLLDYARAAAVGGEYGERMEILRVDNKVRETLGFTPHTGTDAQPWTLDEGETHKIKLLYTISSEISAPAKLALEHPERCRIFLNGTEADTAPVGTYVDDAIKVISLPDIKEGENILEIEMDYNNKSYLENMYLLGGFGVEVNGNDTKIVAETKELRLGDITVQGLPFYTGNLKYDFEFEADTDGEYFIHIDKFSAPLLRISVDGNDRGLMAYAPHRVSLGQLSAGRHKIRVLLYGNRFNSFGTLHNANENYTWYGNSSYRTAGNEWTDSYMLRPVGIMTDIEIEKGCK